MIGRRTTPDRGVHGRLAELAEESEREADAGPPRYPPSGAADRWQRLVRRWVPQRLRDMRPGVKFGALAVCLLAAVATAVVLVVDRPAAERPPPLPLAQAGSASDPAPSSSAAAGPSSSASGLVVSVVGKVSAPGLVTVPEGARVADAVKAAGGVLPGTNVLALNMARVLSDGEQIYVGIAVPPGATPAAGADGASGGPGTTVNLNTATAEQLETLPGVGEVTALAILDWREEHGRFTAVEQLREVDGIGDGKLEKLRDEVTVR